MMTEIDQGILPEQGDVQLPEAAHQDIAGRGAADPEALPKTAKALTENGLLKGIINGLP